MEIALKPMSFGRRSKGRGGTESTGLLLQEGADQGPDVRPLDLVEGPAASSNVATGASKSTVSAKVEEELRKLMLEYEHDKSFDDDMFKENNRPSWCAVPIMGMGKRYGIIRDVLLLLVGVALISSGYGWPIPPEVEELLSGTSSANSTHSANSTMDHQSNSTASEGMKKCLVLNLSVEQTVAINVRAWATTWLKIVGFGFAVFVIMRALTYIVLNLVLTCSFRLRWIRFYYYLLSWNGNITAVLWAIATVPISRFFYANYKSFDCGPNTMDSPKSDLPRFFTSFYEVILIVSITDGLKAMFIDSVSPQPHWKIFHTNVRRLLSRLSGLNVVFGNPSGASGSIKVIPKVLLLPLVSIDNLHEPFFVEVHERLAARALARRLYARCEKFVKEDIQGVTPRAFVAAILDRSRGDYSKAARLARRFFSSLDINSSCSITEDELVTCFEDMYNSHLSLTQGAVMSEDGVGVRAISIIVNSLYLVFVCVVILLLFNIDLSSAGLSIKTFILAWSFALKSSVTRVVESFMFVTTYRAFDVGDRLLIEGVGYTVKEIRLFSSVFTNVQTGETVYVSNADLITKVINNLSRSKNASIGVTLSVDASTPPSKLKELKRFIGLRLKDKIDRWTTSFSFSHTTASIRNNTLDVSIWLTHQFSWRQCGKIMDDKGAFVQWLIKIMHYLEIKYVFPLSEVELEGLSDVKGLTKAKGASV